MHLLSHLQPTSDPSPTDIISLEHSLHYEKLDKPLFPDKKETPLRGIFWTTAEQSIQGPNSTAPSLNARTVTCHLLPDRFDLDIKLEPGRITFSGLRSVKYTGDENPRVYAPSEAEGWDFELVSCPITFPLKNLKSSDKHFILRGATRLSAAENVASFLDELSGYKTVVFCYVPLITQPAKLLWQSKMGDAYMIMWQKDQGIYAALRFLSDSCQKKERWARGDGEYTYLFPKLKNTNC
ncbi:hypothetical protein BJ166DRAFT_195012 [Pestalotiopsis sp. NC0098]|nr:hypothetical protein BJ166DRAFT_195012 [Pestalotiopsis sp. NC0098]